MCILLGKDFIKFFEGAKFSISPSEFLKNFCTENTLNNYIIIDWPEALEFSIDKLPKSTIFDAYNYLSCHKKVRINNEDAFLIRNEFFEITFWKEREFCIQKISINDDNLLKISNYCGGIIPIEFLILDFCKKIGEVRSETWWLYVAQHSESGIRIVAGQGYSLLLSRAINFGGTNTCENISRELRDSLRFLRRFGLKNNVKLITPLKNIDLDSQKITPINLQQICTDLHLPFANNNHIDDCIVNYSYHMLQKHKVFGGTINFKKYFRENFKKINTISVSILMALVIYLVYVVMQIENIQNEINSLKNQEKIICSSDIIDLEIDDENFDFAQHIVEDLQMSKDPINILEKISEFIYENKIDVESFHINNLNTVELQTKLNEKEIQKLKNAKTHWNIDIKNMQNQSANEFEELNTKSEVDKHGACICWKLG